MNPGNFIQSISADLHIQDDNKATAWDYATGSQLHYCKLILQYYRQKSTNQNGASAGDVISARQSTDMKPPFLSPRPPPFPQSRSSTPITPRSRLVVPRLYRISLVNSSFPGWQPIAAYQWSAMIHPSLTAGPLRSYRQLWRL